VIGALLGGWPADRFGRSPTLLWIGILYFVSAVWSGLATDVYSFIIARFIGGLGVGISTIAAPLFIAEIAPAAHRGRLAGMFQFNIVFGILVAFLSNAILARVCGENAWRWMLGAEAFPALIYTMLCIGLPESPRWLISRAGNRQKGIEVLRIVRPGSSEAEIVAEADSIQRTVSEGGGSTRFWTRSLRIPILLAFLIAFFNQLSGINAVLYFAPRIFEMTGMGEKAALLQSIGIGVTNLIFTFVGLALIDRLGRRTLLYIGSQFLPYCSIGINMYLFMASGLRDRGAEFDLPAVWGLVNNVRGGISVEAHEPVLSGDQTETPEADVASDQLCLIADRDLADHGGVRFAFRERPVLQGEAQQLDPLLHA
jgi:sugar porter (SP) family MFS transporter